MALTVTETLGREAVWLLELVIGGEAYRFATQAIEVTTESGSLVRFAPGLQDFRWSFRAPAVAQSVGLVISADVDWARMVASNVPVERSPGQLWRIFPGQVMERARLILEGLVVESEWGASDEALTISLSSQPLEQSTTIPLPLMQVSDATWPVALNLFDEKIDGATYPIILGSPGNVGPTIPARPSVPALMVDFRSSSRFSKVLFAGHGCDASEVFLWDLTDNPDSDDRPVLMASDLLGREISHVNFQNPSTFTQAADRQWYVGLQTPNRGLKGDDGQGLQGAGEIMRTILTRWTDIPLDVGRMKAESDRLDRYRVDTYINKPIRAYDWVKQALAEWLPVIELKSSSGLYFKWLNWRATSNDVTAFLSADTSQLQRISPVKTLGDSIANEITVEYRPFAGSSRFTSRRIMTAEPGQLQQVDRSLTFEDNERIYGDYRCAQSQGLYGVKPLTIKLAHVWSTETATQVAQDAAARFSLPKRVLDYEGGPELEALEVGQVVSITDEELYISNEVGLIWDIQVGQGSDVGITVVLLDNPLANLRLID